MKRCPKCHEDKPLAEFSRRPDGRPQGQCKACKAAYRRAHYAASTYDQQYQRAWRAAVNALIDAHPEEFEELLERARVLAGLLPR